MVAKTRTLGIECARNQCTQQIRTKLDLREKEGASTLPLFQRCW